MTSSSDGWDEMHEQPLDEPLLSEFFNELRSWGTGAAPVPNAALASLLDADPAPIPSPPRRKKKMITSKLAGLGIAAKVALGLGVAAAAVTTAGATGVLPPPAQHAVASVVDAVTPLQLPDPNVTTSVGVNAGGSTTDVTVPGSTTTTIEKDATDDTTNDTTGGTTGGTTSGQPDNHGACVSAVAHDTSVTGRDHGKAVSTAAKSDCGKTDETSSSTTSTSSTSTTSTTVAGGNTASVNTGSNHGSGNATQGNGNHGNGNGNSGKSGRD
jgi:hypothetical protein